MKKPHSHNQSPPTSLAPSLPWLAIVALVTVLLSHRLMAQSLETAGGSLSWKATTSPREVVFNARVFIRHEQFLSPYYSPENVDVIFRCLDAAGVASTEPLIIGGTIDLQQNIWAANPFEPAGNLTLSVREGGLSSDIRQVPIRYLKIADMKDGFMECELLDPAWIDNAPPGSNRLPQDGPTGVLYHLPGDGRYLAWLKGWSRIRQDAAVNRSYLNSGFSGYTGVWEMETIAYAGAGTASPVVIKAPPVIHVPYGGAGTKGQHLLRAEVPQGLTLKWRTSKYTEWRETSPTLAHPNLSDLFHERMESHLTQAPAIGQPGHPDNTSIPFSITPDGVLQWEIFPVGTGFGTPDKFWSFQVMATGVDAANNEVVKTPYDFMVLLDQNGTNRTGLSRAMVAIDCAPRQLVTLGDWVEFSVVGIGVSDQPNEAVTLTREGTLPTGISDYSETLLLSGSDNIVKKKIRFRAAQLGTTSLDYRAANNNDSVRAFVAVPGTPPVDPEYNP